RRSGAGLLRRQHALEGALRWRTAATVAGRAGGGLSRTARTPAGGRTRLTVPGMTALASRLTALQQADSFFPGGAVAWSWGLETLLADGRLGADDSASGNRRRRGIRHQRSASLLGFIQGQLRHRWGSFDRAFLLAAWQAADDHQQLQSLDQRIEAMTLAAELRQGSRRLGLSMLGVHAGLDTPGAAAYRQIV